MGQLDDVAELDIGALAPVPPAGSGVERMRSSGVRSERGILWVVSLV